MMPIVLKNYWVGLFSIAFLLHEILIDLENVLAHLNLVKSSLKLEANNRALRIKLNQKLPIYKSVLKLLKDGIVVINNKKQPVFINQ